MKDFSFISDIINEKLCECGVLGFSFAGNKHDIVPHDGETMSNRSTLTEPNSHNHNLMDILPDEMPDIHSDKKNRLFVFPTDVFHGKERSAVYFSCI